MKKILVAILAIIGIFTLAACNTQGTVNEVLISNKDIYAFSAISSTSLLSQDATVEPMSMQLADG